MQKINVRIQHTQINLEICVGKKSSSRDSDLHSKVERRRGGLISFYLFISNVKK